MSNIIEIRSLDEIIEAFRLNRVEIRNLPISSYALFIIENKIGISTFIEQAPRYTSKQPYFIQHTYELFDTVIKILLDESLEYKER